MPRATTEKVKEVLYELQRLVEERQIVSSCDVKKYIRDKLGTTHYHYYIKQLAGFRPVGRGTGKGRVYVAEWAWEEFKTSLHALLCTELNGHKSLVVTARLVNHLLLGRLKNMPRNNVLVYTALKELGLIEWNRRRGRRGNLAVFVLYRDMCSRVEKRVNWNIVGRLLSC